MYHGEKAEKLLKEQCVRYPSLQLQDLLKALYQSVFGCGHLVDDPLAAADYIRREAVSAKPVEGQDIEPLGSSFCRLHLSYLAESGLEAETLARLFALSAQSTAGGVEELEECLKVLIFMAKKGELPFPYEEVVQEVEKWRKEGFPACRHTEQFRAAYAPAYRVIRRDYAWALSVFAAIDKGKKEKGRLLVAIEGGAAAGKSTLTALLGQVYDCNLFHMDDFFLRPEQRTPERYAIPWGNIDQERFYEEVMIPLHLGKTVQYRRFDCRTLEILPPVEISPKSINIVEGAYSLHPRLAGLYDLAVFLRIDPALQKERILRRNTPELAKQFFTKWLPLERAYFESFDPKEQCEIILEVEE